MDNMRIIHQHGQEAQPRNYRVQDAVDFENLRRFPFNPRALCSII